MPGEIARSWFVPGEGIDRHVISADIQRYLGNDATVRPGDNQGVPGYWIKAYRNLTSAMISDLRSDSQRWRQEQRQTGTREPYVGSRTYQASSASSAAQRREGDSPSMDAYGVQQQRRGNPVDQMQIDPPVARADPRYGQQPQPPRGFQPENGGYPAQGRERYQEPGGRQPYPQDQPMQDAYARVPVTAAYGGDPRYAPSYPDPNPGVPQGYYMAATSGYGQPPIMAPAGQDPRQYPNQPFGQPQPPAGRDRDPRDYRDQRDPRDPRNAGQPGYDDPSRYAYPSPAATVSSVARERDSIQSPQQQQPSPFGAAPPPFDSYGRPVQPPPQDIYSAANPGYPPQGRGDPNYGRERQPAAPAAGDRDRDNRRRRLH